MTKTLVLALLAATLAGCAENVVYRNPQTGQIVDCTSQGMMESRTAGGQLSGGMACISTYRKMGWERVN